MRSLESELTILLRLVVALILSGVLGWERETAGKSAGLRTHMLVGIGAGLFVGLGETLVQNFRDHGQSMQFDPTRVLEAVVAGVGFLAAGSILFNRNRDHISGLTTAGSLWATAGVGVAAGLGRYVLAAGATLLLLFVLRVMQRFEPTPSRHAVQPAEKQRASTPDTDSPVHRLSKGRSE